MNIRQLLFVVTLILVISVSNSVKIEKGYVNLEVITG